MQKDICVYVCRFFTMQEISHWVQSCKRLATHTRACFAQCIWFTTMPPPHLWLCVQRLDLSHVTYLNNVNLSGFTRLHTLCDKERFRRMDEWPLSLTRFIVTTSWWKRPGVTLPPNLVSLCLLKEMNWIGHDPPLKEMEAVDFDDGFLGIQFSSLTSLVLHAEHVKVLHFSDCFPRLESLRIHHHMHVDNMRFPTSLIDLTCDICSECKLLTFIEKSTILQSLTIISAWDVNPILLSLPENLRVCHIPDNMRVVKKK